MTTLVEIVCPDGRVRHFPYTNAEDASADADLCASRGCRFYATPSDLETSQPPCPGGLHRTRAVVPS